MAINISFNNTNYQIPEASLSAASAALKAHLSNVMNGSGAVINLDGVAYNVDSTKLSAATTDFVNHLGKIAGNGSKVVIGGVEYGVGADKVAGAVGELKVVLGNLQSGGGNEEPDPELNPKGTIPDGAYYANLNTFAFYEEMPEAPNDGDVYLQGDYLYRYDRGTEGWNVSLAIDNNALVYFTTGGKLTDIIPTYPVTDRNQTSYDRILESINNKPIVSLSETGFGTFQECYSLVTAPDVPNCVTNMYQTFSHCNNLVYAPTIPNSVTNMSATFANCTSLTGEVEINANPSDYDNCFLSTVKPIAITGSTTMKAELAATANNGNVTYSDGNEILEGDGQEFYTLAPTALSFRSTAPLNELQEIQINGVTVDPSNYTLEEGSTIVTFPIEYLKTLNVGSYEVAVASDSKTVKGGFNVKAPELNEYGFYYNQPYVAFVDYFNAKAAFFIRENGVLDAWVFPREVETCTYTISDNGMTVASASMGELHLTFSTDGTEAYNIELNTNFALGDEQLIADEDYMYYRTDLGYQVLAIDKEKESYGDIKTSINGIPTTELAIEAFYGNLNLLIAPKIPNTVTQIYSGAFACTSLKSITIPSSVHILWMGAFHSCPSLTDVTIGNGLEVIQDEVFADCCNLNNIIFDGTVAEWNAIEKYAYWNYNVPATHVQCSDGQVAL